MTGDEQHRLREALKRPAVSLKQARVLRDDLAGNDFAVAFLFLLDRLGITDRTGGR